MRLRVTAAVREALVPEDEGQGRQRIHVADEGAGGLNARTLGAIHVEGQADDEGGDVELRCLPDKRGCVLSELRSLDRGDRTCQPTFDIRHGDANRLRAEIDPEQSVEASEARRESRQFDDVARHGSAFALQEPAAHLSASERDEPPLGRITPGGIAEIAMI